MTSSANASLVLVGDSDIEFWPLEVLPTIRAAAPLAVSGHSGATLSDTLPYLRSVVEQHGSQPLIIVACAGENDIGNGIALDNSLNSLQLFLNVIFESSKFHQLIFLGPKFEPWLEDDPSYKKKYSKMSRSFQKCCENYQHANQIHFVDCLTMFCGETANVPGAVLGGKAKADYKLFASDKLHLSIHGYRIWKEVVEEKINHIVTTTS